MSIEETVVKVSDKVMKGATEGTLAFSPELDHKPFLVTETPDIKFFVYGRAMGALAKVAESSVELSKDRQTVTHTGEKFERATQNVIEFKAEFGKGDKHGIYPIGTLKAPDPETVDEKFAIKVEKVLSKGLQKFGIIA